MKIGNATTNWQTPSTQRSSSRGGSFAEQLQQATQAQIGTDSSDPRTQKIRQIVGKYDLENLSFNQCVKLVEDLGAGGIIDLQTGSMLIPWEEMILPNGDNRTKEQLDSIIVDPKGNMEIIRDRAVWEGDQDKATLARNSLKLFDELLDISHHVKGHNSTLSTRA